MDNLDRTIINELQGGLPVTERPFAEVGARLGIDEDELIGRLGTLLAEGTLSRFGPMYHAERLGGALTLAAMRIPEADIERVSDAINVFPEVAHNYARDHDFNLWFVLATESTERIDQVIAEIQARTGYRVYNLPKLEEYFLGLRFEV